MAARETRSNSSVAGHSIGPAQAAVPNPAQAAVPNPAASSNASGSSSSTPSSTRGGGGGGGGGGGKEFSKTWLDKRIRARTIRRNTAQELEGYDTSLVPALEAALEENIRSHRVEAMQSSFSNDRNGNLQIPPPLRETTASVARDPWSTDRGKTEAMTMKKLVDLLTSQLSEGSSSAMDSARPKRTAIPSTGGLNIPIEMDKFHTSKPFEVIAERGSTRSRPEALGDLPSSKRVSTMVPSVHDARGGAGTPPPVGGTPIGVQLLAGMTINVVAGRVDTNMPSADEPAQSHARDIDPKAWTRRMLIRSAGLSASYKWLKYAAMHRSIVNERYALADRADRFLSTIGPEVEFWTPASTDGTTDVWGRVDSYVPEWAEMLASGDRVKQLFTASKETVQRLSRHGDEWVEELLVELRGLQAHGGQPDIEDAVASIITGFIEDPSVARDTFNLNMLLLGLPGSGKTTIARKIARVFGACGILVSNDKADERFVEIGRGDLVAQWAGQTAPRVTSLLTRNLERVVFLDEAYAIVTGPHDELGQEAVTAIVQYMDQNKGMISIIAAGYEDRMRDDFLAANPGLSRRFPEKFLMARLSAQYLFEVFWRGVDSRTVEFGGPLQIYDMESYGLVQEFIARSRIVGKGSAIVDALFHTQAAAANELAHRAIRYANSIRTRSLDGRLGALTVCSMARVLYDFTVSKIVQPMNRLSVERYLDSKCNNETSQTTTTKTMMKRCDATGTLLTFGRSCPGDPEEETGDEDGESVIDGWDVVDAFAAMLKGREESKRALRRFVVDADGKLVSVMRKSEGSDASASTKKAAGARAGVQAALPPPPR